MRVGRSGPGARSCAAVALVVLATLIGACGNQDTDAQPTSAHTPPSKTSPAAASPNPTTTPSGHAAVTDPTFRLAVIGDFGTGDATESSLADALRRWVRRHGADALVTTGDNVYPEGDPASFDATWIDPYGWVDKTDLGIVASLGNHDIEEDGGESVMDLLDMPGPWYRRTIGDAELFVLDANLPSDPDQQRWIEQSLARSDERWKIVVFHQPAFSCAYHDGTPEVVERWVPLFEREHVDLVLNGHDHAYQRFAPVDGVTYVVTGGGGASLYQLDDCAEGTPPRIVGNDDEHHFLVVEGSKTALNVKAITPEGSIIDNFSLEWEGP